MLCNQAKLAQAFWVKSYNIEVFFLFYMKTTNVNNVFFFSMTTTVATDTAGCCYGMSINCQSQPA